MANAPQADFESVREDPNDDALQPNPITAEERRLMPQVQRATGPKAIDTDRQKQRDPIPMGVRSRTGVITDEEAPFHPSMALNPGLISNLDGFAVHGKYVTVAVDALTSAGATLTAIDAAFHVLRKDISKSEGQKVIAITDAASPKFDALYTTLTNAGESLIKQVESYEREIAAPLKASGKGSTELRDRLFKMGEMKPKNATLHSNRRDEVIAEAIAAGDAEVIDAVLSVHPTATGISQAQHKMWTAMVNRARNPELIARIAFTQKVLATVQRAIPLMAAQFTAAMRTTFGEGTKFKSASTASDEAIAKIMAARG